MKGICLATIACLLSLGAHVLAQETSCFASLIDPLGGDNPGCILPWHMQSDGTTMMPAVRRRPDGLHFYLVFNKQPGPANARLRVIIPKRLMVISRGRVLNFQHIKFNSSDLNMHVFRISDDDWKQIDSIGSGLLKITPYTADQQGEAQYEGIWPDAWSEGLKQAKSHFEAIPVLTAEERAQYAAEIVRVRLVDFTNTEGRSLQMLLVDWKNVGSRPIGTVKATMVFYDEHGKVLDTAENYFIFVADSERQLIKPGEIYVEPEGRGFAFAPIMKRAAKATAVITRVGGLE